MGCDEEKCCETGNECCEDSKCGCGSECSCDSGSSKAGMIMGLANEAWAELMKEKMKAAFEKIKGDKMDKVAQIGVEACMAYWGNKMKDKASFEEFEEKLNKAMM